MRTLNIKIPAGGTTGALAFAGNYIRIEEASAPFWLRLGNRAYIEIEKGIEAQAPGNWEHIEIENRSGDDITARMVIGSTDTLTVRSFRVVGDVSISAPVDVNSGRSIVARNNLTIMGMDGLNKQKLYDADDTVIMTMIYADNDIRLVGPGQADSIGVMVPANTLVSLPLSGELWIFAGAGATVTASRIKK